MVGLNAPDCAVSCAMKRPISGCLWGGMLRSRIESTWDLWPLAAELLKSQRRADGDVLGHQSSVERSFAQLGRGRAADSEVSELRFFVWCIVAGLCEAAGAADPGYSGGFYE
jgi:hypothetical protein